MPDLTLCEVCGSPLEGHLACAACSILAGPPHLAGALVVDPHTKLQVCPDCLHAHQIRGGLSPLAFAQKLYGPDFTEHYQEEDSEAAQGWRAWIATHKSLQKPRGAASHKRRKSRAMKANHDR